LFKILTFLGIYSKKKKKEKKEGFIIAAKKSPVCKQGMSLVYVDTIQK
jgi:hypothetical protein